MTIQKPRLFAACVAAVLLAVGTVAAAPTPRVFGHYETKKGEDSVTLDWRFVPGCSMGVEIVGAKGVTHSLTPTPLAIGWPKPIYPNRAVQFYGPGTPVFNLFPDPAAYDGKVPEQIEKLAMKRLKPAVAPASQSEAGECSLEDEACQHRFDIRYAAEHDRIDVRFHGQLVAVLTNSGPVKAVSVVDRTRGGYKGEALPPVTLAGFAAPRTPGMVPLMPRGPMHASQILLDGQAKLSLKPGLQTVGGVPMEVFSVAESLDTGLHRHVNRRGGLFSDYYYSRTAWHMIPEYMQWAVPNAFYTHLWVLYADVPQKNRVPRLGTHMTRYAGFGHSALALGGGLLDDLTDKRTVGTLEWTEGGQAKKADLVLAKMRLNIGDIIDIINDRPVHAAMVRGKAKYNIRTGRPLGLCVQDYLDLDIAGAGGGAKQQSSIQVFGATLVESPYAVEPVQYERGNIFANDEKPVTGVALTALEDGAKGTVDYEIGSWDFKTLKKGTIPVKLAKAGERKVFDIDLAMPEQGWYSLEYVFRDAKGEELMRHHAAFTLLGKDTREAGFESPYASWAHVQPYHLHWNNPNWREVAEVMWKAGTRRSWEPPCSNETEFAEYPITMSQYQGAKNPPQMMSDAELKDYIDKKIEEFRGLKARYPHLNTWLVLHEAGGRDLAEEMLYLPPEKGAYMTTKELSLFRIKYMTEVCKRVKKEFPDVKLQLGNGSSSSQVVAWAIRDGFDLDLVDSLGIESKGFLTMPELPDNREAPGMLWALRETARRYGYDKPVSACNEYVFRPERRVTPDTDRPMLVTDYTLRDYLISLVWGCDCISTGHMEDSKSNYYNTNWGAGGQCTAYPNSYPKRMYTAIATFTKVFDKAVKPRRVATGETTTWGFEFARDRKVKDFASAWWTPFYDVVARIKYPAGTKVTQVTVFGPEKTLKPDAQGWVTLAFGSTPAYLVTSAPAERAEVVRHGQRDIDTSKAVAVAPIVAEDVTVVDDPKRRQLGDITEKPPTAPSSPFIQLPKPGTFTVRTEKDPMLGPVLAATLVDDGKKVPELVGEYGFVELKKPVLLKAGQRYGVWIDGNGTFARSIVLVLRDPKTQRERLFWPCVPHATDRVTWDGWHVIAGSRALEEDTEVVGFYVSSARKALDITEMRPVTKPIRFGPIVSVPLARPTAPVFHDSMKMVDDKDL